MMMLTQKESGLLQDMKGQEELCIQKYKKYANEAKSGELKSLFENMAKVEESHLQTVNAMMGGTIPQIPAGPLQNKAAESHCVSVQYTSDNDRQTDAFLCKDMLTAEKHASALYDTSIFEFKNPDARRVLNHIQAEEQQHGQQIYAYMQCNGMYS